MSLAEFGADRAGAPTVLSRGLSLLDAFDADDDALTLPVLAARAGLPKSTAFRMISELVSWGALERTGRGYRLGMRLFELGNRSAMRRQLISCAVPVLDQLVTVTGENVYLTILDGLDAVVLDKRSGRRSTKLSTSVGDRLPLHASASGKVYLGGADTPLVERCIERGLERVTANTIVDPAALRQAVTLTRRRGYGVDLGELTAGVTAVAAPVRTTAGLPVATLAICGAQTRVDPERLAEGVRMAASWLGRELAVAHAVPAIRAT